MIKKSILSLSAALVLTTSNLMATDIQKVYATVNGKPITGADIAVAIKNPQVNFDTLPKETQKNILKGLIDKKLLSNVALNSDVVNDKVYKTTLKSTIENIKEELAMQVWMQKELKKIKISDNEAKKYYNENKSKFIKPMELKARHILVKTKNEAQDIINKLNKSKDLKSEFIKLAKEKSTGPSGKNGGDLGWFTKDKMVPEFSQAASSLKVNSITNEPVKTQYGYHVIYLEDKKDKSTISFDKIKNDIKSYLAQEQFKKNVDSVIQKESKKAKISYK
jgi:parvulin-like peptidyl-prolyl isomerase